MEASKVMNHARPPTILCVDDNPTALQTRKLLLEHAGYSVISAINAAAALQLFKSQTIDLVISDHLLADRTGAEITREMKRHRSFVPMMLLSGGVERPSDSDHADAFITKGEDPVELLKKVADLLRCDRISGGNYFAEIRCDHRSEPPIWHFTIQHVRSPEILEWSQAATEDSAIRQAKQQMCDLNKAMRAREKARFPR